MHDSVKKIRIDLLHSGLLWLLKQGPNKSASRKDIFVGIMSLNDANDAKRAKIFKEAHNKQWQVACLDRLIDYGWLKKTGNASQTTYYITDADAIALVLKDYDNNGTMLAHFLFPKEVPAPSLSKMVLGSDPIPDESLEKEPETIVAEPQELDVGKLLVAVASGVADIKEKQTDFIKRLLNTFQVLLEPFTKMVIENHTQLSSTLENKYSELSTKFDNKIGAANKRIEALETSINSQRNVLEASQAAIKKLNLSEDLLNKIVAADKNTQELQATVNELAKLIKAKEQNKLADILAAVKRNTEENVQLQQLILESVAGSDNG